MTALEKRFKKKLIDKEITQVKVAEHFGWSTQYIRQLIKGQTEGPAAEKNLKLLKEYMGMR